MEDITCNSEFPNRLAGDEGYKGKTLLVTGGTGYMGKVFVEKVLRTCPLVERIYLLVRAKKGITPQARINEIFNHPFYDLLKKTRGNSILNKVVVIPADIAAPNLGLSKENRDLLVLEVELIFHIAASVRFDEAFKTAVLLNTRGTKLMLELAKQCKKLLVFAHVSTAYCHPEETILYEKIYAPPADPHQVIKTVELLHDDAAEAVSKGIKGGSPNTYTFTKALAEGLVNDEMDNLPVIILRPSVVMPVWKDPLPGWVDNLNGPIGLLVACGKGILRTMHCHPHVYTDFVPVDMAISGFMVYTYDYMRNKQQRIYNVTTSSERQVIWKDVIDIGKDITRNRMPLNWVVWYPGGSPKGSKFIHCICSILFHYIPAIILDLLLVLTGNRPVLLKVQGKISAGFDLFEFYTCNQWIFSNNNILQCRKALNQTEAELYKLDPNDIDMEEYTYNAIHSVRLYVLKESDESLPTARRHMKIMWAVDRIFRVLVFTGLAYLLIQYLVYPILNIK